MKNIILFILILILLNLPLNVFNIYLGVGRPIVNIDYLIVLAIFTINNKSFVIKIIFTILFLFVYIIDLLLMIMQIFPFIRLDDLIYLSSFLFNGPLIYIVALLILVVIFIILNLIIYGLFNNNKINNRVYYSMLLLVCFSFFVQHLLDPLEKNEVYARFESKIFGSQSLFFIKNRTSSFVEAFNGDSTTLEPIRYNYSTKGLFEKIDKKLEIPNKILLIVNESWGEPINKSHQDKILDPIYKRKEKLEYIDRGDFNFIGATVSGELRELCRKNSTSFNLRDVKKDEFYDCLPNKLLRSGYITFSNHGAMSGLYDRREWYKMAGLENNNFYEDLVHASECKSFSGRCDNKVIDYVKDQLLNNDKVFVYWLTLNTHAPYDDKIFQDNFDCGILDIKQGTETCNNFKLQSQFFSSLTQLIDEPSLSGLEVYVVGDHSPPIFNLSDNFFSFKGSNVAWIKFKIK